MSKNKHKVSKLSNVPTFVQKVREIVQNTDLKDSVSWTSTKDSFIIKSVPRFTEGVLPMYFKHHNFASFIRQLNMYGFKKVRHSDGDNVYYNEYFRQGGQHLLKKITRKLKEQKQQTLAIYNPSFELKDQNKVTRQIHDLKLKQSNLEDMCKHLLKQNQKLLQENQSFLKRMEKETKQKETRIQQFLIQLLTQKSSITLNGQNDKILSITNQEHPVLRGSLNKETEIDENQTPLQVLGKILENNKQIKKMKEIMSNNYGNNDNISSKKSKNFTIVNSTNAYPKPESYHHIPAEQQADQINFFNDYSQINELPINLKPKPSQNDSFLSINEFLNAEDYSNYNLDLSN